MRRSRRNPKGGRTTDGSFVATVMILIGVVFLAPAFLVPEEEMTMNDRWVMIAVGAGVTLAGFGLRLYSKGIVRTRRGHRRFLLKNPDTPWKARKGWRSNQISSESRLNPLLVAFAIIWDVVHWPGFFLFIFGSDPERFTTGGILYSLVAMPVCVGLLAWLYVEVRRHLKFGRSVLRLEDPPGRLGAQLQGVIQTGIPVRQTSTDSFRVVLRCIRQSVSVRRYADGKQTKDIDRDLLWQEDARMKAQVAKSGSTLVIPFSFSVPPDLPPSTPEKEDARVIWELEAMKRLPGVDFVSTFELPVFPPSTKASDVISASTARSEGKDAATARLSTRTASESNCSLEPSPMSDDPPEEAYAPAPCAQRTVSTEPARWTYDRPVSPGIELDPGPPFVLHFKASRQRKNALITGGFAFLVIVLAIALLWKTSLTGVSMIAAFVVMFSIVVVGLGGFLIYGSLQHAMNDTTLSVDNGRIALMHDGIGMPSDVSFPAFMLESVTIESDSTWNQTSYALTLLVQDDTQFDDLKAAKARGDAVLTAIGVPESHPARQQLRAGSLGPRMRVAGGIEHRGEAEWLAREIQEAARREHAYD